jgi:transposase InsO family protein
MSEHGATCSLSRSGSVWDNAAMENFFPSLRIERVAGKIYRTRDQFDYIERFFDPRRGRSATSVRWSSNSKRGWLRLESTEPAAAHVNNAAHTSIP